ncbi:fasciclin domain-containing protein [Neomicrococcus aestuarii]|uniref:Fasciclin n=3 Tax=Neomicrococcus TaxID=1868332 RepID=A0A1L2ZNJ0_9MICC|nr:fasciclin [Neomicrococcus aestuarii]
MKYTQRKMVGLFSIAAVAALGMSACSMGTDSGSGSSSSSSSGLSMAPSSSASSSSSAMSSESAMDPAANLVGTGCAAYAKAVPDGEGSVAGMAQDPVAVAASNNPLLTTLTKAVSGGLNKDVNLVDTLNGDEFTVFAPVDEAFAAIPAKDLKAVTDDADTLTKVLTYHVVPGQITPDDLKGDLKTVEGDTVKISGSGDKLMVNGASVICGGVQTANATVYLVDTVLMPPAKK